MANTETNHDMEQSILKVAEELFLDKGFNRTSTTEIARVVGCTPFPISSLLVAAESI